MSHDFKFSKRIMSVKESETLKVAPVIARLKSEGKEVINFAMGELDFDTPEEILNSTKLALDKNQTRYSAVSGLPELKKIICEKLRRQNNVDYSPSNILVSNGSKQVLYSIFQAICDPGDEVIIPTPYWVSFAEQVKLAGARPVFAKTVGHQLDMRGIEDLITGRTRAVIINSPNNPTGAVYRKSDIIAVSELAAANNFFVVADDAYELLTYDAGHTAVASLGSEIKRHTITVNSFSKIFSMTGFRLGYLAAEEEVVKHINNLQSHLSSNPCTFAQYGAIQAYSLPRAAESRLTVMRKRRDLSYDLCRELFPCIKPEGALYLFPDISEAAGKLGINPEDFSMHLIEKANVATVAGDAFGAPNNIRISYSCSEEEIEKGFARIKKLLEGN